MLSQPEFWKFFKFGIVDNGLLVLMTCAGVGLDDLIACDRPPRSPAPAAPMAAPAAASPAAGPAAPPLPQEMATLTEYCEATASLLLLVLRTGNGYGRPKVGVH